MRHIDRVINFFTDEGTLEVSRVENGTGYDQYNRKIPREYFKYQLDALHEDWINPNVKVKTLANAAQ